MRAASSFLSRSRTNKDIAADVAAFMTELAVRVQHLALAWLQRRRAAGEMDRLARCTDYELRDMGLSRSDLPAIMRGTYRRD